MKPTIGRIVHFKELDGSVSPGIITKVYKDQLNSTDETVVNLQIFQDEPSDTPRWVQNVLMAEGPRQASNGQWWWPERV